MERRLNPHEVSNSMRVRNFYGPHVTQDKEEGMSCLSQIQKHLKVFGYSVEVMKARGTTSTTKPSCHSQNRHDRKNFPQFLYCGRCSVHSGMVLPGQFRCTVIGKYLIHDVTQEEATRLNIPKKWLRVELTQLYPHSVECTITNPSRLLRNMMSLTNSGPGFTTFHFDYEEIIGDMFDHIINELHQISKNKLRVIADNKYGTKEPSGHCGDEVPHIIARIKLDKVSGEVDHVQQLVNTHYFLAIPAFQDKLMKLRTRLTIFLANHLGIANEFVDFQQPECQKNEPTPVGARIVSDKQLTNPSIIFGGFKRSSFDRVIHQCPHREFGNNSLTGMSIEDNVGLRNISKPMSVLIPLRHTHRRIIVHREIDGKNLSSNIKINHDEAFVYEGNVATSGYTYNDDTSSNANFTDLYPALHFYVQSSEHPSSIGFHPSPYHIRNFVANEYHIRVLNRESNDATGNNE